MQNIKSFDTSRSIEDIWGVCLFKHLYVLHLSDDHYIYTRKRREKFISERNPTK